MWPTQTKYVGHYLSSAFFPSTLAPFSVSTHISLPPFTLTLNSRSLGYGSLCGASPRPPTLLDQVHKPGHKQTHSLKKKKKSLQVKAACGTPPLSGPGGNSHSSWWKSAGKGLRMVQRKVTVRKWPLPGEGGGWLILCDSRGLNQA